MTHTAQSLLKGSLTGAILKNCLQPFALILAKSSEARRQNRLRAFVACDVGLKKERRP